MKREFLRGLGVADEHIQQILDEHHDALKQYKDKAESSESLQAELDTAKEELKNRDTQISQLEQSVGSNEELQNELEKYKQANSEFENKLKQTQLNNAIKVEAMKQGVVDSDAFIKLIDTSSISQKDDGTIEGLDTLFESTKDTMPYMFTQQRVGTTPPEGSNPALSKQDIMSIKDPRERQQKIKENINLFK